MASKSSSKAARNVRRSICSWHVAAVALAFPGVAQADLLSDWP
jgi:hypothetical protein